MSRIFRDCYCIHVYVPSAVFTHELREKARENHVVPFPAWSTQEKMDGPLQKAFSLSGNNPFGLDDGAFWAGCARSWTHNAHSLRVNSTDGLRSEWIGHLRSHVHASRVIIGKFGAAVHVWKQILCCKQGIELKVKQKKSDTVSLLSFVGFYAF